MDVNVDVWMGKIDRVLVYGSLNLMLGCFSWRGEANLMALDSYCVSDEDQSSGEIGVTRLKTLKIHIKDTRLIICHF